MKNWQIILIICLFMFSFIFSLTGLNDNSAYWNDINVGGVTLRRATVNQPTLCNLNGTNILTYCFEGTININEVNGNFELLHGYKENTNIYPHAYFYTTTTNTGNVTIFLDYLIINTESGNTIIKGTLNDTKETNGEAWKELFFNFNKIDENNLKVGSQIHFRIYRNPADDSDNYESDIAIGTFGVHYLVNSFGSKKIMGN